VELTPFHDIPKATFLQRMLLPCLLVGALIWMSVGVWVSSPGFSDHRAPSAVIPFWEVSLNLDRALVSKLNTIPGVCWSGNTTNEFQKHQCDEFWNELIQVSVFALIPLLGGMFFLWVLSIQFQGLYQRAQKKIKKGKVSFGGVVTHPARAPQDPFSWFYCLRPITVELKNKSQVTVYVSSQVPSPLPGETLAVFDMGKAMGETRYLGIVYAPHVAIFRAE
jgi:hypothetical protein